MCIVFACLLQSSAFSSKCRELEITATDRPTHYAQVHNAVINGSKSFIHACYRNFLKKAVVSVISNNDHFIILSFSGL